MRFNRPLLRLPIRFCAETLARQVSSLPGSAWVAHPNGFPGNEAVRLITPGGMPTDALSGSMAPTEYLRSCPYIVEIMSELGGTWGRSRLMGLAAGAEVPAHVDSHYYWRTHLRIHIPVITNPGVEFTCGGETVHMAAGDCWVFDSFQRHEVHNRGDAHRVHLVLDTVGGRKLWDMMEQAHSDAPPEPRLFEPGEGAGQALLFERVNVPTIMSPWELRCHIAFIAERARPHPRLDEVMRRLEKLVHQWGALWAAYADPSEGVRAFQQLLAEAGTDLSQLGGNDITLTNDLTFYHVLGRLVFEVAIARPEPSASQGTVRQPAGPSRLASEWPPKARSPAASPTAR
jgi:hypothetical protein